MRFLDLFAGIGGFSLGLERAGMTCVGQVEIDEYCNLVLEKHWPNVPRWRDIREFKGTECGAVDLICGGFPCQPFSCAGKRRGQKDDRYLWPEMLRVIEEVRPRWVLGENVAGIINMELDKVLSDLEDKGYACQALVIPACAQDAPHRRDRVWIVGHAECNGYITTQNGGTKPQPSFSQEQNPVREFTGTGNVSDNVAHTEVRHGGGKLRKLENENVKLQRPEVEYQDDAGQFGGGGADVADTEGLRGRPSAVRTEGTWSATSCYSVGHGATWEPEPGVGRVADGVPGRVDRLRALGNAVVPQIVEVIGRAIIETENAFDIMEAVNTGTQQPYAGREIPAPNACGTSA